MRDTSPDRLYNNLPAHITSRDAEHGYPLKAFFKLLTRELSVVEDNIDDLYNDWFIETCAPWVAPYIGELLGVTPLIGGELAPDARAYVANTIAYRQGKGTVRVMEQLARDITGWPSLASEMFLRLIQTQNMNHIRKTALGTVDLRDTAAALRTGQPFETAYHNVDVRSAHKGGRYNIPNIVFYAWRLTSAYLPFVFAESSGYLGGSELRPFQTSGGLFHFDPFGRNLPLFNRPVSDNSLQTRITRRSAPLPLNRRELYSDREAFLAGGDSWYFNELPVFSIRLDGAELPLSNIDICRLEDKDDGGGGITWRKPAVAGTVMVDPQQGRLSLHPSDHAKPIEVAFATGMAMDIGGGPYDRRDSTAKWREAFPKNPSDIWHIGVSKRNEYQTNNVIQGGPVVSSLSKAINAWNTHQGTQKGVNGIIAIMDNALYTENLSTLSKRIVLNPNSRLAIISAGMPAQDLGGGAFTRTPQHLTSQDRRATIISNLRVRAEVSTGVEIPPSLILDGLMVQGTLRVDTGDLGRLEIYNTTLGGDAEKFKRGLRVFKTSGAGLDPDQDNARLAISMDRSISGDIHAPSVADTILIENSIVGEELPGALENRSAILAPEANLKILKSTIWGQITGRTLQASNAILEGKTFIAHRQTGCVRYSYIPLGSRAPRRFRCVPELQISQRREAIGRALEPIEKSELAKSLRPQFLSSTFRTNGFGLLSQTCVEEVSMGAEQGAAMGVTNHLGEPFKLQNLNQVLQQYTPMGRRTTVLLYDKER